MRNCYLLGRNSYLSEHLVIVMDLVIVTDGTHDNVATWKRANRWKRVLEINIEVSDNDDCIQIITIIWQREKNTSRISRQRRIRYIEAFSLSIVSSKETVSKEQDKKKNVWNKGHFKVVCSYLAILFCLQISNNFLLV